MKYHFCKHVFPPYKFHLYKKKQNDWMADKAMGKVRKIIGKWTGNTSRGKENAFRMTYPLHMKSSKRM